MLALSADSNGIRSLALRLADRGIWEAAVLRGGRRARHRQPLLYLTLLPRRRLTGERPRILGAVSSSSLGPRTTIRVGHPQREEQQFAKEMNACQLLIALRDEMQVALGYARTLP